MPAPASTPRTPARLRASHPFALRWLTIAAALACVCLWTLNFWAWPQLGFDKAVLGFRHGAIEFRMIDPDLADSVDRETTCVWLSDLVGYELSERFAFFRWFPSVGTFPSLSGRTLWHLDIPLWLPFAAFATLTFLSWRTHLRRKHAPHACPHCHYDLSGLAPQSACPECGR